MKLYNTLSRSIEAFKPLKADKVRLYSCGPTLYDHIHIGNLSSFIYADALRRALQAAGYDTEHVMNFTDVDDKTIRRSQEQYPDLSPQQALEKLTQEYGELFLTDMEAIGNDLAALAFVRATQQIAVMQKLISQLYKDGFGYIADDGVYFSIEKYKKSGKHYGQLLELHASNTSAARINNDEYDKESVHDFALWKLHKDNEPAWEFELDGHNLLGRPGWHIECSAMSIEKLGQPFDIHTGGTDLIFPHHENEIAQSTAGKEADLAKFFVHNEHLLVDGRKMSKSLNNFYTLEDVQERGYEPLAFRLLVLQSHYRSQSNFSWENVQAASNRLRDLRNLAALRFQLVHEKESDREAFQVWIGAIAQPLMEDLNTPVALAALSQVQTKIENELISASDDGAFTKFLQQVDALFGLDLMAQDDISDTQKQTIQQREKARTAKDWQKSDDLRAELEKQGIGVRDTDLGPIWFRL